MSIFIDRFCDTCEKEFPMVSEKLKKTSVDLKTKLASRNFSQKGSIQLLRHQRGGWLGLKKSKT